MLTNKDFEKIGQIVKEEVQTQLKPVKDDIAQIKKDVLVINKNIIIILFPYKIIGL